MTGLHFPGPLGMVMWTGELDGPEPEPLGCDCPVMRSVNCHCSRAATQEDGLCDFCRSHPRVTEVLFS